jgi:prepilin-type N-terminal cleavage/methylation domain-containing protein
MPGGRIQLDKIDIVDKILIVSKMNRIRFSHRLFRSPVTAFTLIELLTVIAIIGIVAAMALPALNKAKNHAVEMTDVNNLKQIITAVNLYGTDYGDILPAPDWLSQDRTAHNGWLYALDASASGPSQFQIQGGLLWPMLKNQSLYMCPMDYTNTTLFVERDQQLSSYAMNGAVVGFDRTNFPAEKISRMQPEDVAYWETDEQDPTFFNDGANLPSEGVSGRHLNGAINATFAGAVSYVRLGAWYVQVYDTNKNSLWCYPESSDGR